MYSKEIGGIAWVDLTVKNATEVRDFYNSILGTTSEDLSMGEYSDYVLKSPQDDNSPFGVCHARGSNANIPPQWMVYFNVESLATSMAECEKKGGKILCPVREMGGSQMCVIQDPAGAVAALIEKKGQES